MLLWSPSWSAGEGIHFDLNALATKKHFSGRLCSTSFPIGDKINDTFRPIKTWIKAVPFTFQPRRLIKIPFMNTKVNIHRPLWNEKFLWERNVLCCYAIIRLMNRISVYSGRRKEKNVEILSGNFGNNFKTPLNWISFNRPDPDNIYDAGC